VKRLGWQAMSAWVIRRSGLFDLPWYTAQLEGRSPGLTAAVAHYVLRGRAAGLSPSPLFEPSWYAPKDWRTRHADPLAALIRRGADATADPHPLFDRAVWSAAHPDAARHPGGPFGHFCATAGSGTPMPVDPATFAPFAGGTLPEIEPCADADLGARVENPADGAPAVAAAPAARPVLTWAAARAGLDAALQLWRRDERRRRAPRVSSDFDHGAAVALVERCAAAALPDSGDRPLVSVVLPVKDRREQVRHAVASVQAQSLDGWELIVVDDGSTDGTADLLAELAAADSRIRVLRSGPDGRSRGVCAARNIGAAQARGRYVAWLDSDNRWLPCFLQAMVVTMAERNRPIAYAAAVTVQADGRRYRAFDPGDDPGEVLALLEVANHIDLNVLVVERGLLEAVGGFDETLRRTVDYDLVWRLAQREVPLYVGVIGVIYDADDEAADRITVRERPSWREVVKNRRLIDWSRQADDVGGREPGRVSVIVVAEDGWAAAWVSVASVLRAAGPVDDVEVLVVDDGGRRADAVLLSTLPLLDARVRFLRTPVRSGRPLATNLALAASTGAAVALVQAGVELWPGWAEPVRQALADPGASAVAPLVLGTDGRLLGAGLDGLLGTGLDGLNVEDARRLGARPVVPELPDEVVVVRAADLIGVQGLDPLYVAEGSVADLCLRLPGRAVLATAAVASCATRLRPGVALAQARTGPARTAGAVEGAVEGDQRLLAQRRVERRDATGAARTGEIGELEGGPGVEPGDRVGGVPAGAGLRWVIKTALPVGPDAVRWGDLHFAQALAAALERLGQHAVIDHRPAIGLPGRVPQDVVLVLRGLEPAPLRPAGHDDSGDAVRMMWVISHPEAVTDEELRGQDRVFAASTAWARRAGQRAGVEVLPLLQCTDPARFHPGAAAPDSGDRVLFVGNSRNVFRPVVRDLLAAGVDVAIYGDKWDRFLGPGKVRGRFVPNERLAAAYASAGVVLNDHWDDMRTEGFYSNRLFDAAACGARIVSDHIEGLELLFGGLARTFRGAAELVSLVREVPAGFPDDGQRLDRAHHVAAEHSFDARARTLLDEVLKLRG
jgi:GT2 family glycosyltransferase